MILMNKFFKSVGYALRGIAVAFTGSNLKIQRVIALLVLLAGFYFKISRTEWCLIIIAITSVLAFELVNTALEKICDFVHPEKNEKIRDIKDISAGAVLLVSISAFVLGLMIFLPKIFITLPWN